MNKKQGPHLMLRAIPFKIVRVAEWSFLPTSLPYFIHIDGNNQWKIFQQLETKKVVHPYNKSDLSLHINQGCEVSRFAALIMR